MTNKNRDAQWAANKPRNDYHQNSNFKLDEDLEMRANFKELEAIRNLEETKTPTPLIQKYYTQTTY